MRCYEGQTRARVLALMSARIAGPLTVQAIEVAEEQDQELIPMSVASVAVAVAKEILRQCESGEQ
jgi:hypothetical protein